MPKAFGAHFVHGDRVFASAVECVELLGLDEAYAGVFGHEP